MNTWRRIWKRPTDIWTFKEEWLGTIRSLINLPDRNWRLHKKSSRRLKRGAWHQKWIKTPQSSKFWLQLQSMFLKIIEGHARQNWVKFNKFWFFVIFGFLAKTHGHRHFCLGHLQRMKMVSLDAIISGHILSDFQIIWRWFSPPKWRKTLTFSTLCPVYQQGLLFGLLHTGQILEDF